MDKLGREFIFFPEPFDSGYPFEVLYKTTKWKEILFCVQKV